MYRCIAYSRVLVSVNDSKTWAESFFFFWALLVLISLAPGYFVPSPLTENLGKAGTCRFYTALAMIQTIQIEQ